MLGWIFSVYGPVRPYVHLIGSAYTVLHTSTLSLLAAHELPLSSGYAPIQLGASLGQWSFAPITAGGQATYTGALSWTFSAALSVFGYYLSDDADGLSLWGESFNPYYVFPAGGGTFALTLPPYLISCPGVAAC